MMILMHLFSYPVKKEVGKVGEDSPLFIIPLDSAENKSNIANFFTKSTSPKKVKNEKAVEEKVIEKGEVDKNAGEDINSETHAPGKRKLEEMAEDAEGSPRIKVKAVANDMMKGQSPVKTVQRKPTKGTPQSTKKSPVKKESGGSKITNFFGVKKGMNE